MESVFSYLRTYAMLVLITMLLKLATAQMNGLVREYCMETFNPTCEQNSVVVMQQARYGRMRIGRCMKRDFGLPSCSANELIALDEKCSGKKSCELVVPSPELAAKQSCLEGTISYLEASYTCQKVHKPRNNRCISPEQVPAKKKPNYLASATSKQTSCGIHESPWILEALPGQKISISLVDFSWQNNSQSGCRIKYGNIFDMANDDVVPVCGRGLRKKHLYTSVGHTVQIVLEEGQVQQHNFLIKYQAIGCPQYAEPKHSTVQLEENLSMVIKCEHSNKTWKLKCVDNIWLGIVSDCEPPPVQEEVNIIVEAVRDHKHEPRDDSSIPSVSDNHVVAFALGCVTLIICCTIVFFGIYCTKRYEAHVLERMNKTTIPSPLTLADGRAIQVMKGSVTYKPVTTNTGTIASTMELPPYAFPKPKGERPPSVPNRNTSVTDPMITSTTSDYLQPQNGGGSGNDDNSVLYYVLENPAEMPGGTMSEEMYQSIRLHNSLNC